MADKKQVLRRLEQLADRPFLSTYKDLFSSNRVLCRPNNNASVALRLLLINTAAAGADAGLQFLGAADIVDPQQETGGLETTG